jgi:hypothetical protein
MTLESYHLLKRLLGTCRQKIAVDWQVATALFDDADATAHRAAYAKVTEAFRTVSAAESELKALVQEHYAKDPDPEIRKLWGVE